MKIIVTGCAGFIGYHVCAALAKLRHTVIGIDNLNQYYDVQLKLSRLQNLKSFDEFTFQEMDLLDKGDLKKLFKQHDDCETIMHLAAQAGVRYSVENPKSYIKNNILATTVLFETIKNHLPNISHILNASSSSVYGGNEKIPFSEKDPIDKPLSIYAATKASAELISHSYTHQYALPISTLRFFTVYGPYGRPDMIPCLFTKAIMDDKPITLYNKGMLKRDFTYIDDIINGLISLINKGYDKDHHLFNLGNHKPIEVKYFVSCLEKILDKKAVIKHHETPSTEPDETYANIKTAKTHFNFNPKIEIEEGLESYVRWYKQYYHNL